MPKDTSQSIEGLDTPVMNQKKSAVVKRNMMILKMMRFAFQVGGHLAPPIAGRIAYKLWFTPTRFKTPSSEKNALETADVNTDDNYFPKRESESKFDKFKEGEK